MTTTFFGPLVWPFVWTFVWIGACFGFLFSITELLKPFGIKIKIFFDEITSIQHEIKKCSDLRLILDEWISSWEAGLLPSEALMQRLSQAHAPWNHMILNILDELRSQGASVAPTLRRIREGILQERELLLIAKAKGSQALAQAWICWMAIPLVSGLFYQLIPTLNQMSTIWWCLSGVCLILATLGVIWVLRILYQSRWLGLSSEDRELPRSLQFISEGFLAYLSCGIPYDTAWERSLSLTPQDLVIRYQMDLKIDQTTTKNLNTPTTTDFTLKSMMIRYLAQAKQIIHFSIQEGRPCRERMELAFSTYQAEMKSLTIQQMDLLPQKCLKPLFILVAPAVFLLVMGALGISALQMLSEWS